jgi:hypothetical protein
MIDFTPVAVAAVGGLMTIVGSIFLTWLQAHMKDQAAAVTINNAVTNALGAVQNAVATGLKAHPLQAQVPGLNPATAAGVQYVLDNAGPELERYAGITPALIASKIEARIGLAKQGTAT